MLRCADAFEKGMNSKTSRVPAGMVDRVAMRVGDSFSGYFQPPRAPVHPLYRFALEMLLLELLKNGPDEGPALDILPYVLPGLLSMYLKEQDVPTQYLESLPTEQVNKFSPNQMKHTFYIDV